VALSFAHDRQSMDAAAACYALVACGIVQKDAAGAGKCNLAHFDLVLTPSCQRLFYDFVNDKKMLACLAAICQL
jgi:hypothetical protein